MKKIRGTLATVAMSVMFAFAGAPDGLGLMTPPLLERLFLRSACVPGTRLG